jgi:uncharacterized protein
MIYKKRIQPFTTLICLFITQIDLQQFTIPRNQIFKLVFMIMPMYYASEKNTIRRKLINYDTTTTQIVIITIESLKGEDIGILHQNGTRMGNRNSKDDNGVLILLAKAERKYGFTWLRS